MKKLLDHVTEMMKPYSVFLVGGAVRDYILGNEPKDFDFCTDAEPDEIERLVKESGKRAYLTGKRFGTIGCKVDRQMIEITTFRTEEYEEQNRKPEVEYVKNLHQDLSRRDFTINAMAIRLLKGKLKVIDNFGGQDDLKIGIIRAVGYPKQRFKEDPLRILRAIRFACRFDFEIEENTLKKMQKMAIHILDISKERWVMELDKILLSDNVDKGLKLLWTTNLFRFMIPELHLQLGYKQNSQYHKLNLDEHTTRVVKATPKDINLRWSALLHDIAKPFVRTENVKGHSNYIGHADLGADMVNRIATHLKWSNERHKEVAALVKNHLNDDCPLRKYDNESKK